MYQKKTLECNIGDIMDLIPEENEENNTLELLDKEIPGRKEKIESVQLCFTTDPLMVPS